MNNSKPLTKKQKAAKTKKQIKILMKDFTESLLKDVDKAVNSGGMSDKLLQDNIVLAKAVIVNGFKTSTFFDLPDGYKKDFVNIQYFI